MATDLLDSATGSLPSVVTMMDDRNPSKYTENLATSARTVAHPAQTSQREDAAVFFEEDVFPDDSADSCPSEVHSAFESLTHGKARARRPDQPWERFLRHRVMLADALAIYSSVFAAYALRWGIAEIADLSPLEVSDTFALTALGLMLAWFLALGIADSRNMRVMGSGSVEYRKVWNATFAVFGLLAIIAYLIRWNVARSFVGIALPLGLLLISLERWILRRRLVRERAAGKSMSRSLMIGSPDTARHLISELKRVPEAGLKVVAVCTPGVAQQSGAAEGRKVTNRLYSLDQVVPFARAHGIDTVIVSGSDEVNPAALKRLAWDLEPHHIDLIMAPELTGVSSARKVTQNVAGLSLLHVDAPGYTSSQRNIKRVSDVIGSLLLIGVFSVPLAVTAIAIKLTSRGPILFKQERIGEDGQPFEVFKFRSMYADAESRLQEVLGGKVGLFYKPKNDPRVTPVGKFIRRYSIDELPQLFNVLKGDMSLVGPRPQIPAEVEQYENGIERRLFVKPGMTGLWQVSGRNNLSVEESMNLDLYYVENWSMTEDMVILAKTAKAVISSAGAY